MGVAVAGLACLALLGPPPPVSEGRAYYSPPDPTAAPPPPNPGPTEVVTPVPVSTPAPVVRSGFMSWMPEKYGARYLALPQGAGHRVRVCGVRCITIRSNDIGPVQRIFPDRVADLGVVLWEQVCGLPRSRGLCPVTVTFIEGGQ